MKHIKLFEQFLKENKDEVIFSIDDEKLDQILHSKFGRKLDYEDVKGDSYYSLPKREFDQFIDFADSSGFDVDYDESEKSVIYVYESRVNEASDKKPAILVKLYNELAKTKNKKELSWGYDDQEDFPHTVNFENGLESESDRHEGDLEEFSFYLNDDGKTILGVYNLSGYTEDLKTPKEAIVWCRANESVNEKFVNESVLTEAKDFRNTKNFIDFLEEIDGMPEAQIKKIMGKNYIDTPGGYAEEKEDYDDIEDYMISNMGRKEFERLQDWWEANVQESVVTESHFKVGNKN